MSEAEVEAEVATLRRLSRAQLQDRWRALFKKPPPAAFTPDLMARSIAYRLQEKVLGGLPRPAKQQLESEMGGKARRRSLRPGNRLVRRWRGRTYVVEVGSNGLSYDGTTFGSLSEIARKITGTRWSGPRFFGLGE